MVIDPSLPWSMRQARVGGAWGSMLSAKVNGTPANEDQLDLLLQLTYTQSYTRQNKGKFKKISSMRFKFSEH